ncbi:unnamed protein product [Allacma fusca]|uniref:Uncharacterized protein n=1 Tax=Allacma fusca TaxID=39272 RepID=A0A8J2LCC6_9HEXA|nr:unnamed protein product [Allacma fusca]
MNSYIILLLLGVSQTLGELSLDELKDDLLKKISSPNDTSVQAEAKDVIAEYLINSVLEDNDIAPDDPPIPFRRDKEKDKEKQKEREKNRNKHKNRHRPHIDYRDTTELPVANPPVASVAGLNPAIPAADIQTKQDATQSPVVAGAPAIAPVAAAVPVVNPGATAVPIVNPAAPAAPAVNPPVTAAPETTTSRPRRTRPTVDPNHVYQQVDKILGSVASGNIVGIVDESLAIRAPTPVRNFVTGILKVIFCNPVDRIFGRCKPDSTGAISSVQG